MTRDETIDVLAMVRIVWPHSELGNPGEAVRVWQAMLAPFDRGLVEATITELAATGREHAPLVGVVVATLTERAQNAPDFDEAKIEILTTIRRYRPPSEVAERNPYAAPPAEYWSHPLIAAFAEHVWDEWRMAPDPDSGDARVASDGRTFHAQQRDAYKALRARTIRDASLAAVGAGRRQAPARLQPGAGIAHLEPAGGDR